MQHVKTVRHRTICDFPCYSVGFTAFLVSSQVAITISVSCSLPVPAIISRSYFYFGPKICDPFRVRMMVEYVSQWLTLYMTTSCMVFISYFSLLTTTTMTIPIRDFHSALLFLSVKKHENAHLKD